MSLIWTPFYLGLEKKRQTLIVAHCLNVAPMHACGMLMVFFGWLGREVVTAAHKQGDDAVVPMKHPSAVIDGAMGVAGFTNALAEAEWLSIDDSTVTVRRYFEKNGTVALKRAVDQAKKNLQRAAAPTTNGAGRGTEPPIFWGQNRADSRDRTGTRTGTGVGTVVGTEAGTGTGRERGPTSTGTGTEENTTTTPGDLGGGDLGSSGGVSVVGMMVDGGVAESVAERLARQYPAGVIAVACRMGLAAKAVGAKNPPGIIVSRLRDGTAAREYGRREVKEFQIEAREWARTVLAEPAMKPVILEALRGHAEYVTWSVEDALRSLPDGLILALADRAQGDAQLAGRAPVAFAQLVAQIKGKPEQMAKGPNFQRAKEEGAGT